MIKSGLIGLLRKTFGVEEKLHPIDRRIAKRWIKQRLVKVFPELRNDPARLERAYQSLTLEPRIGTEEGDAGTYYQIGVSTDSEE